MNSINSSKISGSGKKSSIEAIERKDVIDFISKKTGISIKLVKCILDLLIFVIKKSLIENGSIRLYGFGTIFTRGYRRKNRIKCYGHRFRSTNAFKRTLKGEEPPLFVEKYPQTVQKNLYIVCEALNLELKDVKYLYSLFIYCIILNLLKYKVYRILRLGCFYIDEGLYLRKSGISKKWVKSLDRPANIKKVRFKQALSEWKELNKKTPVMKISKKLKRMFHLLKIDRTTNQICPLHVIVRKKRILNDFTKTEAQ